MPRRYVHAVFPEVSPLWGYEGDTSAPNGLNRLGTVPSHEGDRK